MKALSLRIWKIWPIIKFFKRRSRDLWPFDPKIYRCLPFPILYLCMTYEVCGLSFSKVGHVTFDLLTQKSKGVFLSLSSIYVWRMKFVGWDIFIRPTCRDILLWYGAGVCPSVHKACKHDTDWTVWARTVKLGSLTTYDKRMNPIDFQGQGSKVKVTRYILMLNLVNTIQTEPFQLGQSNLVHILLMIRGRHLLIFKVRGSKVKVTHYILMLNLVNTIQTEPLKLGPSKLVHILLMTRGQHLLICKVRGQRSRSHATHYLTL